LQIESGGTAAIISEQEGSLTALGVGFLGGAHALDHPRVGAGGPNFLRRMVAVGKFTM
jgi:hypothetical protein